MIEIKETEEEVARWKEACELEVKAGKKEIEERDKMVKIFFVLAISIKRILVLVLFYTLRAFPFHCLYIHFCS